SYPFHMESCKDLQFCEPSSEERSAGNPHATLCGSRVRETGPATRWVPGNRYPYRDSVAKNAVILYLEIKRKPD
ncbi:MAG: hypothetical protein K9I59_10620, partial [Chlorobium sp.]|uniref:hypothetical protein n=1 Tax=Chlorobium sp. TaxID=1095 RepID=UPI0025BCCE54